MGIIGYIVLGLVIGAIAKAILPGRMSGGWIATLVLGVVGAVVGGLLGNALFDIGLKDFWSIQTWLVALVGALLVLFVYGWFTGRSRKR